MSNVIHVTFADFEEKVLKADGPVLVDFWASWCFPCVLMAPVLDELSVDADLKGKLTIAKFDVEAEGNDKIAREYEIMSLPTFKLFSKGKIVNEFIGARPAPDFKPELEEALKTLNG